MRKALRKEANSAAYQEWESARVQCNISTHKNKDCIHLLQPLPLAFLVNDLNRVAVKLPCALLKLDTPCAYFTQSFLYSMMAYPPAS